MKIRIRPFLLFEMLLILTVVAGCEKEKAPALPELSTSPLSQITSTTALAGGNVTSDGGSAIIARGTCWGTGIHPDISNNITIDGTGKGDFSSSITGLESGTNYYIRAYATNEAGTAYGNEQIILTPLTDIEGNIYGTTIIGDQVWTTQNLRTTLFNDNSEIPEVADNKTWGIIESPAFCWYNNDEASYRQYFGALYNWFAVSTGKLCPEGWHVPAETEWVTLTRYLGGEFVASGKLKEEGIVHWISPNIDATNIYGYTALPGGYRSGLPNGLFEATGYVAFLWSGTESDRLGARARMMTYDTGDLAPGKGLKRNGYSVRCIKDHKQN